MSRCKYAVFQHIEMFDTARSGEAERDALSRNNVKEHEIRVLEFRDPRNNVDLSLADAAMRPKFTVNKDDEDIVSYIIKFECITSLLKLDPTCFAVRI